MSGAADGATPSRSAWQPFTFGGLAAFARAGLGRLAVAELVFAILVSGSVVYFLQHAYAPVILQAIEQMPESARIARGHLMGIDTTLVAETKWLAIAITPETSSQIGQSADIQVQLRPTDFRIGTAFRPDWGWEFDYGPWTNLPLGPSTLEPWWGAWHPVFLAIAGVSTLALMYCIWAVVALIYTVPAKFIAWFGDRQLSWIGAGRLASAALLPGSLLMAVAILLYAWRAMDLIGLVFVWAAHLVTGWVYVAGGSWACPRLYSNPLKQNPFTT